MYQASDSGHGHIGTEHLLMGLVSDTETAVGPCFGEAGVEVDTARARFVELFGSGKAHGWTTWLPIGPKPAQRGVDDRAHTNPWIDGLSRIVEMLRHLKETAVGSQAFDVARELRDLEYRIRESTTRLRDLLREP